MAILNKGQTFSDGEQVTSTKLNTAVDGATFASGAVDDVSTQLSGGAIIVKDGGVTTAKIADDGVTTAKIEDDAVTTAKIADSGVTTTKIADNNVITSKIADSNVTTAKITDSGVTTTKIADDAVTTSKIADSSITTLKIADSNITTAKIANNNVTTSKIANSNITTSKIADSGITLQKLATSVKDALYPVGSIYTNATNSANPSTLIGFGTWAAFGAGRVLVGIDGSQSEFNSIGETGGSKTHTLTTSQIPSHNHNIISTGQYFKSDGSTGGGSNVWTTQSNGGSNLTGSTGGGQAHNNLQPYIVVYMWKRTA